MEDDRNWTEKDFKIERKVGEGSFGAVYKAKNIKSGEIVAMKKLKVKDNDRKNFEGIVQEIRVLCSIEHKYIVSYKGSFWDADKKNLFIVMEFLGGGDLNDKIQKCKKNRSSMPESKIWSYLIQMLKGLKILHDLKIIHRDIKSANCFLSEDLSTIKLGDMNVSKVVHNFTSTQVGTPLYLSPQIWLGKSYDNKTDIWSLGVLLYEMCTLNYPFMGLNMESLKRAVTKGNFAPIPGYLNKDFSTLIKMMLQYDPVKRPSVDELLNHPIIKNKMNNLMEMTIQDLKKQNIRLMDTIKIPHNYKNVNLPKKKANNLGLKRSNSVTDARPTSSASGRQSPNKPRGVAPISEKSESQVTGSSGGSKRLPPVPMSSKALPPLGNKNRAQPLVGKPEIRRDNSRGNIQRPTSRESSRERAREKSREILMQAEKRAAEKQANLRDRYRAPSAGKANRGSNRPVFWG